jgi:protein involved in polysaccharide export with SLBB domain
MAGWLIFLVSVVAFSETWAQTMSLGDQSTLLEMYRQKSSTRPASTPQTYSSPAFNFPDSLAAPLPAPPVFVDAPSPQPAIVYQDSIPKPGGRMARFGSDFFRSTGEPARPPSGPVPPSYRLGPGDRLYVTAWGRVDLEYDLAVDPTGQVYVPKVGAIRAFGLALSDFEQKLKQRLQNVYSEFELSVTVSQIRAVQVHVYGEVVRPGSYTLNALSSLLNVLTAAGGPNDGGSYRQIKLVRKMGENQTIDLYRFFTEGSTQIDMPISDGDIVFVPVTGPQVTVRGEIRRPGVYELLGGEPLQNVLNLAGGAKPDAYLGRVLVDRIDPGDSRKVLDCNLTAAGITEADNIVLMDGDDVSVYPAYDARDNVVWISGAIKHSGAYEHQEGMTVYQLVQQAGGLVPEAYTARADLERHPANDVRSLFHVPLDSLLADSTAGPRLEPRDKLVIYDRTHLERPRKVHIAGSVKLPGEYDLFEEMHLSDLVFRAGNPNRSAYLYRAEIARLVPDGGTEILYADLATVITNPSGPEDPPLAEDDQIFVREIPRWRNQELVAVEGEVMFPGSYALAHDGETLWELLQRSGGLTPDAFPRGTVFIRKSIAEDIERNDYVRVVESSVELREDSLGMIQPAFPVRFDPKRMTRLVINLDALLKAQGREGNVELRDGDRIHIPKQPSGVQVMGAVAAPGTILFESNKKSNHYIRRAGDFTNQSDKGGTLLIKADGRVFSGGEAKGQKVEKGDAIFVPQEIKKDRDWWKIVTGSVSIVTGVVTTALLVDRL